MHVGARAALAFVVGIFVFYFVFWVPGSVFLSDHHWVANGVALLCAIFAARFVWIRSATPQEGVAALALKSALIVGGIGFAAGFFGPMLLGGGNQGPLLGLFITGPLGFLLGGAGGLVRGLGKRAR